MAATYTSFLFSKAPKYLLEKRNQIIMVLYVSIFAIIFINIYKPFESIQWITTKGFSSTMYYVSVSGSTYTLSDGLLPPPSFPSVPVPTTTQNTLCY